jgi:hypothetical protein
MGFFLKFFALIMGLIMAFFSKSPANTDYEPKTEDINGVTYKNCFIPEYVKYNGVEVSSEELFTLIPGEFESWGGPQKGWYKMTDKILSRGSCPNSGLEATGKRVFCRESDWNNLKEQYYNLDNWNYKLCNEFEISREMVDYALMSKIMQFAYDCYYKGLNKSVELPINSETLDKGFYIEMEDTIDNLFCASSQICVYNGEFYMEKTYVSEHHIVAYKFPEELQGYIGELAEQYYNAVNHFNQ